MIEPYFKILPFYDTVEKQRYRRDFIDGDRFTVDDWIAPHNLLLPFQILRNNRVNAITEFALYSFDDTHEYNLLSLIVTGQLKIKTVYKAGIAYNAIVYYAQKELSIDISCGQYYYKVSDGTETWYSEIFTVRAFDGLRDENEIITGNEITGLSTPTPLEILTSKK